MRWQDWLVEALKDKGLSFIDDDELAVRNALREFFACQTPIIEHAEATLELAKRIARLEQFHCEHEFSNRGKGCLESVFCSKCGAVHPDWERDRDCDSSPGRVYVFKTPENMAVIDGRAYRKKKEEG